MDANKLERDALLAAAPFVTKLGKTRAGERSRIWIEGKRLAAAGFVVGEKFRLVVVPGVPADAHLPAKAGEFQLWLDPKGERTVSGKGDKPIIDIVGAQVIETFGQHGTHVSAQYVAGLVCITIKAAG